MNFRAYWDQLPRDARDSLAEQCKTNRVYLSQIATNFRSPSPAMARRISDATGGAVSLAELRPDVYKGIAA